jgi:hypothetical protein
MSLKRRLQAVEAAHLSAHIDEWVEFLAERHGLQGSVARVRAELEEIIARGAARAPVDPAEQEVLAQLHRDFAAWQDIRRVDRRG